MPGELDAALSSAMLPNNRGDVVETSNTDALVNAVMEYMPGLIETVVMSVKAGYGDGNGPGVRSMVKSIEHAIRMELAAPIPFAIAAIKAKEAK